MGRGLWRLWRKGVIRIEDAIGPDGVRSLESVVRDRGISIPVMVGAGISAGWAHRAHEAAKSIPRDAHARRWAAVLARATGLDGVHLPTIRHIGAALAASPVVPVPPTPGEVSIQRQAALELAARLVPPILASDREKRLTDAERKIVLAEMGPDAARSVAAFLSAVRSHLAAGVPLADPVIPIFGKYAHVVTPKPDNAGLRH